MNYKNEKRKEIMKVIQTQTLLFIYIQRMKSKKVKVNFGFH